MSDKQELKSSLEQLSQGLVEAFTPTLRLLADAVLFAPISLSSENEEEGIELVKLVTVFDTGRRYVPVFTEESGFNEWSNEKYQMLSLCGADLALSLPPSTHILVNPDEEHSVEFTAPEVEQLAHLDEVEEEISKTADVDELLEDITDILARFPGVEEGYFVESVEGETRGIVGLLTNGLNIEERFLLVCKIAELSRNEFGASSALDVFDDLHDENSSSWELFKAYTPFYEKVDNRKKELPEIEAVKLIDTIEAIPEDGYLDQEFSIPDPKDLEPEDIVELTDQVEIEASSESVDKLAFPKKRGFLGALFRGRR